jgi:hypothetical protein
MLSSQLAGIGRQLLYVQYFTIAGRILFPLSRITGEGRHLPR